MNLLLRYISLLLLLTLPAGSLFGQSVENKIDSVQLRYYRWCSKHITDPVALNMADTLFQLAGKDGNRRMQSVAMCLKIRHYYFTENADSLKAWVERTKEFTHKYDQPIHYFSAWNRLIVYYAKHNRYILAQEEVQNMLEEARKTDQKTAIIDSYMTMGQIYITRTRQRQAAIAFSKAVDYMEENNVEYAQASHLYSQLAKVLITNSDKYDLAKKYLLKAEKVIQLPEQIYPVRYEEATLLWKQGRFEEARKMLLDIEQHYPLTESNRLRLWADILIGEERYGEAIEYLNKLLKIGSDDADDLNSNANGYINFGYLQMRALCYAGLGRYAEAYQDMRMSEDLQAQKAADDSNNNFEEYTALLDNERLNRERVEAEQQIQIERLRQSRLIIGGMAFILLLSTGFIVTLMRMNRHLARAKRAAEESNRMKTLFIRNITHEINTPLNAILGFSEMAAEPDIETDERTTCIETVRENGDRLQKLVDNVLDIADLEASERTPETDSVDLVQLCHRAMDTVTIKTKHPLDIHIYPDGKPLPVRASGMLITKALTEMLYNAAYFAPDKPIMLDIALDESARMATFTVTDHGKGIPAAEAEHIFERFFKLDTFTDGLGLGLSVCRLIADTLGGEIHLDTTYTEGARFVFTVPITTITA